MEGLVGFLFFLFACYTAYGLNNDDIGPTKVIFGSQGHRETIGVYKLLAIRVTSSFGQEPEESLQEIEEAVFTHEISVANQFSAISHNQLVYKPATSSGVLQIKLQKRLGRYDEDEDAVVAAVETMLNVSSITDVADRLLFCFPTGSLDDDVQGLAQKPGQVRPGPHLPAFYSQHDAQRSYYHKRGCAKLWVMMHELGHNLRFSHSGIGDDEYQDRSGYMGDSPSNPATFSERIIRALGFGRDDPRPVRRAFNGHKHWLSGWFAGQQESLDLSVESGPFFYQVVCFVDANKSLDRVLLRVDHTIFIQFNCAQEYNSDAEVPNTVTFTRALTDTSPSDRLAALVGGQSYDHEFENSGKWTFQVCSTGSSEDEQVSVATLSIHTTEMSSACPHPVSEEPNHDPPPVNSKAQAFLRELLDFSVIVSIMLLPPATIVICWVCLARPSRTGKTTKPPSSRMVQM